MGQRRDAAAPQAATALVGDLQLLIPLAGLIDKDTELARLRKNIARLEQDVARIGGKLGNDNFVARAPESVVAREREKLGEAESALARLKQQAESIAAM